MRCRVLVSGEPLEFETHQQDEQTYQIRLAEERFELVLGSDQVTWNNTPLPFKIESMDGRLVKVRLGQELFEVEVRRRQRSGDRRTDRTSRPRPALEGGHGVEAPMPGMVITVEVEVGQEVAKGQVLLILEAMKMENEIPAPLEGKVRQILVKAGDNLNGGDVMVVLE